MSSGGFYSTLNKEAIRLRRLDRIQSVNPSPATYNLLVASFAPLAWWRHDETTGNVAADSSGNGYQGTSVNNYSSAGVSVAAVSGYAGLGSGHKSTRTTTTTADAALAVGGLATGAWTILCWVTGGAAGSQYVISRINDCAIIYGYVPDTLELFSGGADTRTGSQISLPHADTTTPHMIAYRYANTDYSGWKDSAQVFAVTRSLALPTSVQKWTSGGYDGGGAFNGTVFDFQTYDRRLTDTELEDLWASRNVA